MTLCASCGLATPDDAGLCAHHHAGYGDDWANANRIMCDFFHRQRVPRRLAETERNDDFTAVTNTLTAEGYVLLEITRTSGE